MRPFVYTKHIPTLFVAIALLSLVFSGLAPRAQAQEHKGAATLEIQGEGTMSAAIPDMAMVTLGVVSQDQTARQALDANNNAMKALIDILRAKDIEQKDVQTSGFRVNPRYSQPQSSNNQPNEPPRIIGYEVANTVSIRVRDLDILGSLIDNLVTAGSNTVSSIQFTVADPEPFMAKARQKAMANALEKANLYADAAGVTLKKILHISENSTARPLATFARAQALDVAENFVPLHKGQIAFNAQVFVRFELDQ